MQGEFSQSARIDESGVCGRDKTAYLDRIPIKVLVEDHEIPVTPRMEFGHSEMFVDFIVRKDRKSVV